MSSQGSSPRLGAIAVVWGEHRNLGSLLSCVRMLAREHLTAEDWREIDTVFSSNADPLFGEDRQQENEQLYKKIANLAPAPCGLGAPWDKKVWGAEGRGLPAQIARE